MGIASHHYDEFNTQRPCVFACPAALSRALRTSSKRERNVIMAIEAYCMKCKEKKEMKNPVEGTTKNGKPITKGTCPVCGSTICRIGAAK